MKYAIGIMIGLSLLAGCANTGSDETALSCAEQDWGEFGKRTSESGREVRTIDKYREGCSNFDDQALEAYLDGYARGLISFCTFDRGYEDGLANKPLDNICPYEIQAEYNRGYTAGLAEFNLKKKNVERLIEQQEQDDRLHRQREMDKQRMPGSGN